MATLSTFLLYLLLLVEVVIFVYLHIQLRFLERSHGLGLGRTLACLGSDNTKNAYIGLT